MSEYNLEKQETQLDQKSCVLCQNLYEASIPFEPTVTQKVIRNFSKYLHSAIVGNNLKGASNTFTPQEIETFSICPQCFESGLELNEMDEQLESIQKSINDFMLT